MVFLNIMDPLFSLENPIYGDCLVINNKFYKYNLKIGNEDYNKKSNKLCLLLHFLNRITLKQQYE